jgi:hypothetical protein
VQQLKVGQTNGFLGTFKSRTPLSFSLLGGVALRATWGGHLLRFQRDLTTGQLALAPDPPLVPGGILNAASMLIPERQERLIIGANDASTGGHLQLYGLNPISFQLVSNTTLDSSKQSPATHPTGTTDVRTLIEHPLHRWFYALYAQNPAAKESTLVTVPLFDLGLPVSVMMPTLSPVKFPMEFAQGMVISPDGKALYVGGQNRVYRSAIDLSSGAVSTPESIPLPPGIEARSVQVYQGAVCQIGSVHHVYAPLVTSDKSVGDPPLVPDPKAGLWHLRIDGNKIDSTFLGPGEHPGLGQVRHVVASKDCSRLFVGGSEFAGAEPFFGKFRPVISVFQVNPTTGALTLEAELRSGTDFQNIVRDPFVALSPDEQHLYVHSEWIDDVSVFAIRRSPGGNGQDPLLLRNGPPLQIPDVRAQPASFRFSDACPPGQVLRGFRGRFQEKSNPLGQRLATVQTVCQRVLVEQGATPSLALAEGLTTPSRGNWAEAQGTWSNLCPAGAAAVGYRPRFLGSSLADIELWCAPLEVSCGGTIEVTVGKPVKNSSTASFPPGVDVAPAVLERLCPPGMISTGALLNTIAPDNLSPVEVVDNVALLCSKPSLAVSPSECVSDGECGLPPDGCDYAVCVQGKCERERKIFSAPSHVNPDCRQVCGPKNSPPLVLDVFPFGEDNGENVKDFLGCVQGCMVGQEVTLKATQSTCDGSNQCAPGGMCVDSF